MSCLFRRETLPAPADGVADMEDSLTFVGFGKFQILIMAYSIVAATSIIYDTTSMSYVITSAECDLRLSYMQKGQLNAMTYIGMTVGVIIFGCISDTLGRRKTLVYAFLLDFISNFIASFSRSFQMLAFLKFLSGLIICGPCTVMLSCMGEFFSKRTRSMYTMYISMCISIGATTLPFVAWSMLGNPSDFHITSKYELHSWQIFLAVCSIPSLTAGVCAIFMPESPCFLAVTGKLDESLDVLKYMYSINTGRNADTYPVKQLFIYHRKESLGADENIENATKFQRFVRFMHEWFAKVKPLFHRPHISNLLITFVLEYGAMTGVTLRLWLPQLFKLMSENVDYDDESICGMIKFKSNNTILDPTFPDDCTPITMHREIFLRNAIISSVQILVAGSLSYLITIVGKRTLLMATLLIAGVCCSMIILFTSAVAATALSAIVIAFSAAGSSANINAFIYLIPTELRATAVAAILAVGRVASITGNIVFPVLMSSGCLPVFLTIGFLLIGSSLFAFLLPKSKRLT